MESNGVPYVRTNPSMIESYHGSFPQCLGGQQLGTSKNGVRHNEWMVFLWKTPIQIDDLGVAL